MLTGDRFMPELHLRYSEFSYSVYGPFTEHRERIKKFKGRGDLNYIYKNKFDEACFAHDAASTNNKDLAKRRF